MKKHWRLAWAFLLAVVASGTGPALGDQPERQADVCARNYA